jgi:hypothetical protein
VEEAFTQISNHPPPRCERIFHSYGLPFERLYGRRILENHEYRKKEGRVGDRGTKNGFLTQHIRRAYSPYSVGLQIFALSIVPRLSNTEV